jgi:hypothetical protein
LNVIWRNDFIIHKSAERRSEGLGDINLVGKYVLLWDDEAAKNALLTVKGSFKLNNGDYDRGLGRGDLEYALFPVVSKSFGDLLTVHGQAGYTFVSNRKNPDLRDYYFYGAAFDVTLIKPLHFVAEFTGNRNPDRTLAEQLQMLTGITFELSKNLILDATFKKGFGPDSPRWGFGIGAAIEF